MAATTTKGAAIRVVRVPTTTNGITFLCINALSVANKAATICQAIVDGHLDIIVITKTWHEYSESVSLNRVTPAGF